MKLCVCWKYTIIYLQTFTNLVLICWNLELQTVRMFTHLSFYWLQRSLLFSSPLLRSKTDVSCGRFRCQCTVGGNFQFFKNRIKYWNWRQCFAIVPSSPAPSYPLVSPITPSYPGVTTADQQVVAAHKSMSVLTQLSCNNNKVYWTCDSLRISFQLQKIQENKLISVLTAHQQQ